MKRGLLLFVMFISALALIAGCASAPKAPAAPAWVTKGSGAFEGDAGKVFYGVGMAQNIKTLSLLRQSSDANARNEIAKQMEVYSASLYKEYQASTSAGDAKTTSEEQHVERALKEVTAMTLNGVQIIDHYQDPQNGVYYALAKLDMNAFKDMISKNKELNEKTKEYIRKNADKVHDQLEKEEAKHQK